MINPVILQEDAVSSAFPASDNAEISAGAEISAANSSAPATARLHSHQHNPPFLIDLKRFGKSFGLLARRLHYSRASLEARQLMIASPVPLDAYVAAQAIAKLG